MKIGIIGSRSRNDYKDYVETRKIFLSIYKPEDWICSGGCPKGGDRFAKKLHKEFSTPYLEFPANWDKWGKRAGFVRNKEIATACDILIACMPPEGSKGTQHTIDIFRKENPEGRVILVP